jgi:hypothetical protein
MRTLVVGISLPHFTFDNASFLSAPSFSEYGRVIVDLRNRPRVRDVEGTARYLQQAMSPCQRLPSPRNCRKGGGGRATDGWGAC